MVATVAEEGEATPRCACGSLMQKAEVVSALRYLDFLREEAAIKEEVGIEKE
jgi:hypothetical protein